MQSSLWRSLALVPLVVCLAAGAGAADPPDRTGTKVPAHTPGIARPVLASSGTLAATAILGTAWTADNAPIKQANLRLRNVVSGKVQSTTVANDAGQFVFENVPGGSYVVELLNEGGRVAVVGQVLTIAAGETVATFVRTTTKLPWSAGFFNNSISAISSAAASQGVAAIAPLVRPVSPKQ